MQSAESGKWSPLVLLAVSALAGAAVAAAGIAWHLLGDGYVSTAKYSEREAMVFVGSATCAGCHQAEAALWSASQHKHAMDHATEASVLGDFGDATFDYFGTRSRFFRKDGKFLVETDGADGRLATFEVKYTFGVEPLQQYLIEFPDGRLQALTIAWDTRSRGQGGQRWFHLYPDEPIRHDDQLHWTKLNQNWNFMCAECHSTGVRRNYDAAADRFATTWAEISVACEACHGQGSRHVVWARKRQSWWPFGKVDDPDQGLLVRFDERQGVTWPIDTGTGNARRSGSPGALRKEVETCGRCHARRGQISEEWIPGRWLSDTHTVTPLSRTLQHADGQMRDGEEVYNYSQFKQSRMFEAGVTCSDCHDPHSGKLRSSVDNVCSQCHAPDKYRSASHHNHGATSPVLACTSCHMPVRTYMGVDRRHDHRFLVPRPDLSITFGTPNACNDCHRTRSFEWAASVIERWFGTNRKGVSYAAPFHAGRADERDADRLLSAVAGNREAPSFVRAGALSELSARPTQSGLNLVRAALRDLDPMVRIAALDMLERVPPAQQWPLASPLLSDGVRGVRIRAVELLAAAAPESQPPPVRAQFERAAAEFIAAQRLNADRPEARSTLGNFFARLGLAQQAEAEFKAALRLDPLFAAASINLSDLYRELGRDAEGAAALRTAIGRTPTSASLRYALGLALVRLKQSDEALSELQRAAELAPDRAQYAYAYAVALHSAGRPADAMKVLTDALTKHPNDRELLLALVTFNRDAEDYASALGYAERLAKIAPSRALDALIEQLRLKSKK